MAQGRKSWGGVLRFALCGVLLVWVFHRIFSNEAQQYLNATEGKWDMLSKWEQRSLSWRLGPQRLLEMARRLDALSITLALTQCGALVIVGGLRWRYVLGIQGLHLGRREATRISFVAHFFNAFLLGSAGGDVLKAWYAARLTHHRKAEAVVTVFVDRLMGIFALLVFAVALIPLNLPLVLENAWYRGVCLVVAGMMVAVGGLVWIGFYSEALAHDGPMARLFHRIPKGDALMRALSSCRTFGRHRRFLPIIAGWSLVVNVLIVMTFVTIARGLGLHIEGRVLWMVVPMVVCLAALPITPSGLGVRESLLVALLTVPVVGISHGEALSLSLLAYLANLAWSAVGGLVYVFMPDRKVLDEVRTAQ